MNLDAIYSCGDCPVCAVLGDTILVEALGSGTLFLVCARCGAAFEGPFSRAEEGRAPASLAPEGFVLPGAEKIDQARAAWGATVHVTLEPGWEQRLGPGFKPAG